jgi:hypothetical protein
MLLSLFCLLAILGDLPVHVLLTCLCVCVCVCVSMCMSVLQTVLLLS